jgi:hypothetical protein
MGGGAHGIVCSLPPRTPFIQWVGVHLTPIPKAAIGWQPREKEGGGDQGWWGPAGPPNPNPGRPGPGAAPHFSFSLMGFFPEIVPLGDFNIYYLFD